MPTTSPERLARPAWLAALRAHVANCRQTNPIPADDTLSPEEDWQRRLVGGSFIGWYQDHYRDILAERSALRMIPFDPEPIIVFTTDMPGLVAAQQVIPPDTDDMLYLLPGEFAVFEKNCQPESFTFHVHYWNRVQKPGKAQAEEAASARPDVPRSQYRLHTMGELWHERCGFETSLLWRWDGRRQEPELLLEDPLTRVRF